MQRQLAILSHLRWVSAALVALSHFRNLFMEDFRGGSVAARAFYFVTGFGHSSVIVFFVLSGFLVGRKVRAMARQDKPDLRRYAIDRFTRIFTVAWPAMALSYGVLVIVLALAPGAPYVASPGWSLALNTPLAADLGGFHWLGLSVLLNELVTPTPAINGPLWSLACEWTYCIVAGAAVALYRRRWSWLIPYALLLLALAVWRSPMVVEGGLVWLLGLAASIVADRDALGGRASQVIVSLLAAAAFAASRLAGAPDLALGFAIAALIAHSGWKRWSFGAILGERLAGFSYTLYATHFPLALLFLSLLQIRQRLAFAAGSVAITVVAFLGAVAIARLIALATEDRVSAARDALLGLTRPRASRVALS